MDSWKFSLCVFFLAPRFGARLEPAQHAHQMAGLPSEAAQQPAHAAARTGDGGAQQAQDLDG